MGDYDCLFISPLIPVIAQITLGRETEREEGEGKQLGYREMGREERERGERQRERERGW